jgi:hypothetical protein
MHSNKHAFTGREALARQLEEKLKSWTPQTVEWLEHLVAEIIRLADADALELLQSRAVERECSPSSMN